MSATADASEAAEDRDVARDLAGDALEASLGHPVGHIVRTYARPHALRFGIGLLALALARIPQPVPALLFGVALDALPIGGTYGLPLVPDTCLPGTQ